MRGCLLVLLLPSSVISEPQPTRQELESEIFCNVSFPSVVLGSLLAIKKEPSNMQEVDQATFILKTTIDLTLQDQHDKFTAALLAEVDFAAKTRYQRMALYHLALAAFLSGLESGGQALTATFVTDELIARLAAKGWEFEPYRP